MILKLYKKLLKWCIKKDKELQKQAENVKFEHKLPLCFIDTEWGKKVRLKSDVEFRDEYLKWVKTR